MFILFTHINWDLLVNKNFFSFFDVITRIRNANLVRSRIVYILKSKLTVSIIQILKSEGFIDSFEFVKVISLNKSTHCRELICVHLKFRDFNRSPYINCIKRVSKPGVRVYVNSSNVPKVLGGIGIAVFV